MLPRISHTLNKLNLWFPLLCLIVPAMSLLENSAKQYAQMWAEYGLDVPEEAITALIHGACQENPLEVKGAHRSEPTDLTALQRELENCKDCKLSESRNRVVFGEGPLDAKLLFVGEGPGPEEDQTGRPFVGQSGQLLDKIIKAMGFKREDVYLVSLTKCHAPDRGPTLEEISACHGFLKTQIDTIQPRVIVALGSSSFKSLTASNETLEKSRGKFQNLHWQDSIKVMPTYHPAYLLENPTAKSKVWADMQQVMKQLNAE